MFGFNDVTNFSHLEKTQVFSPAILREGLETRDLYMVREEYFSLNFVSIMYSTLRPIFVKVIKNLIKNKPKPEPIFSGSLVYNTKILLKNGLPSASDSISIESNLLLDSIVLPSINAIGTCYWNGRMQEKGKEEQAFGILLDQFTHLQELNAV